MARTATGAGRSGCRAAYSAAIHALRDLVARAGCHPAITRLLATFKRAT
jgi:hypothetical protein